MRETENEEWNRLTEKEKERKNEKEREICTEKELNRQIGRGSEKELDREWDRLRNK